MQQNIISIMENLAPEALQLLRGRYDILRYVKAYQPVGRRQLCKLTGFTERTVRTEIDAMKNKGYLMVGPGGINLSEAGESILHEAEYSMPDILSLHRLGQRIAWAYGLKQVLIVPGDSEENPVVKQSIGRVAAELLHQSLKAQSVVAVAGGSTLAEVAASMIVDQRWSDVFIVPARGGLDEDVELQANTIAAVIARQLGAQYRLLHLPGHLELDAMEVLMKNSQIREVVQIIKSSSILIHGIGSAIEMAERRYLDEDRIENLQERCAIGEALRYYYDKSGNVVGETPGIGLEQEDLANIDTIIAVAGGSKKIEAIRAVLKSGAEHYLVTDEAAARGILNGTNGDYNNAGGGV